MGYFANYKQENYATIAGYLHTSLTNDLTLIASKFTRFNADYLTQFQAKADEVKNRIKRETVLDDQKQTTKELYRKAKIINKTLTKDFKTYIKLALPTNPNLNNVAFPFEQITHNINSKNIEGATENLNTLHDLLNIHKTPLMQEGMTQAQLTELQTKTQEIFDINQTQNTKINITGNTTAINTNLFAELDQMMTDICNAGKNIFKDQPQHLKEYTPQELKKRVKREGNAGINPSPQP